jgi:hypothetical protein
MVLDSDPAPAEQFFAAGTQVNVAGFDVAAA